MNGRNNTNKHSKQIKRKTTKRIKHNKPNKQQENNKEQNTATHIINNKQNGNTTANKPISKHNKTKHTKQQHK